MRLHWNRYIHRNKEGYSDCQLVTALNAHYHLYGEQYCTQCSKEYDDLVELTGCRAGGAINIERAHKLLGIEVIWSGNSLLDLPAEMPLPMEWNVWDWGYGFHSTLIIEHDPRSDCVRVTNFRNVTDSYGWMFRSDMKKYENFSTQRGHRLFRLFGITGDPWNRNIKRMWKKEEKRWFTMMRDHYQEKLDGRAS